MREACSLPFCLWIHASEEIKFKTMLSNMGKMGKRSAVYTHFGPTFSLESWEEDTIAVNISLVCFVTALITVNHS